MLTHSLQRFVCGLCGFKWAGRLLPVVLMALSVALAGCTMRQRPQVAPRVTILDVDSPEAIQACAEAHGLAGMLQRIDAKGNFIRPPAEIYCVILPPEEDNLPVDSQYLYRP